MKIKNKNSLLYNFLLFTKIIVVVMAAAYCWFFYSFYTQERIRINDKIQVSSSKLNREFRDAITYVEYIAENLARQIRIESHDGSDLEKIGRTLSTYRVEDDNSGLLSFTSFDWAGKDQKIVVNSIIGILDKPVDVSHRSYAPATISSPGRLHLSQPSIGVISGKPVIPAGIGLADDTGSFMGMVTLGIDLERLASRLESSIDVDGLSFAILNSEYEVIIQSPSERFRTDYRVYLEMLKEERPTEKFGILNSPSLFQTGDNEDYLAYQLVDGFPYMIAIVYDHNFSDMQIREVMLPKFMELMALGLFLIIALYILRKRIIDPIMSLSVAANQISQGDYNVSIKGSGITEISNLAMHIAKISDYLKERKIVETELRAKTIELKKAKDSAELANSSKTEFLAFMSHEIRTPLNAIMAFSELMKNQTFGPLSNEKYLEYTTDIHKSGKYILGILNDLLDITKAESGMIELQKEKINVVDTVEESIRIVEEMAKEKNIIINTALIEEEVFVYADEVRIKQIILNLLSNAIKFTKTGGSVTILVERKEAGSKGGMVSISVSDTGIGMEERDIPVALSKFGQIERGQTMNEGGIGLGLPITKTLVELHGGTFQIKSKSGVGTTATINIQPYFNSNSSYDENEAA